MKTCRVNKSSVNYSLITSGRTEKWLSTGSIAIDSVQDSVVGFVYGSFYATDVQVVRDDFNVSRRL